MTDIHELIQLKYRVRRLVQDLFEVDGLDCQHVANVEAVGQELDRRLGHQAAVLNERARRERAERPAEAPNLPPGPDYPPQPR